MSATGYVGIKENYLSRLAENAFLESFLYTSCMSSLPTFCYQVSCFHACLHYVQYVTKNHVSESPG